ncbi:MAG: CapA family protein, partial [Calditrichaeota bacterium]|nr:CapA family protein [Calditrichota bacterium]
MTSRSSNDQSGTVRILVGGDLCAVGRNEEAFVAGDRKTLLGPLDQLFGQVDLRLVNLECPLIEKPDPLPKIGPLLGGPRSGISGLKALGVDLAVLANNHIMDHSASGLASTMDALDEMGILHTGAGL